MNRRSFFKSIGTVGVAIAAPEALALAHKITLPQEVNSPADGKMRVIKAYCIEQDEILWRFDIGFRREQYHVDMRPRASRLSEEETRTARGLFSDIIRHNSGSWSDVVSLPLPSEALEAFYV